MNKSSAFTAWGILIILAIVWGSSFILIKYGLDYFTAAQVGTLRVVIASLFLMPFAIVKIKNLKRRDAGWLFVSGLLGYLFPALLFAYAEQVVDSSVAGILNSLTPIFTLIVALTLFGGRFKSRNIAGVVLGLFGALALMRAANGGIVDLRIGYSMLIVIATICYAFNVNIIKHKLTHLHSVDITSFSFMMVFPIALVHLLLFTPIAESLSKPGYEWGLLYLGILAVVGSAVALMLFNYLIKLTNVIFSSSVTYLIPIVATLAGVADGEPFKASFLIWVGMILAGVFLVNSRESGRESGVGSQESGVK